MEFAKIEISREESGNECKRHMLPLSADFPKFKEFDGIYDGKEHENIILICENINEGLAAAGRILNCCLGGKKATRDETDDIFDVFGDEDEEEPVYTVEPDTDANAFLIYNESEISKECNDCGDWDKRKEKSDAPQYNISGLGKLIIVCDGVFALSDKLMNQLKHTAGNIIVIIPKYKANTGKINDLMFDKGFECYEIPARSRRYYENLLEQYLDSRGYECFADTAVVISNLMEYRKNYFNEYDIKTLCDKAIAKAAVKAEPWMALWADDFQIDGYKRDETSGEEMLKKIIGLEKVKAMIKTECARSLQNKRMAEYRGVSDDTYKSICFKGNAGTGKTTMARALSKIYAEAGVTNGVFVEVSRGNLVGVYVGETSQRVMKVFGQAAGGVLFIDEAGTIANSDWDRYGMEALGAIVYHMDNNPNTVVIFATYSDEMERLFELNQGLKSRISNIITFESYTAEELVAIFKTMAEARGYTLAPGFRKVIGPYFDKMRKTPSFGNGRDVRKLLEAAIGIMAVQNQKKEFNTVISLSAIRQAVKESLDNQPAEAARIGFQQE